MKSDINASKNISKDAMILTFSKIINTLIVLISSMLLSRFRSLSEYGTYSQIQTAVGLIVSFFMLGLPNSINYFLGKANDEKDRDMFLSLYYLFCTILSIVSGVVLFFSCPLLCKYYKNDSIDLYSYVLLLLPWSNVMINSISNMLVASGKTTRLLLFNISLNSSLLFAIIITRFLNQSFQFYMVFYIVVECVFSVWVYIETLKLINKVYLRPDYGLLIKILKFSIPIGLATAVGTLDIYLDHLMVGRFFDTDTLAVFSNASKELPFNIIAASFTAVLVPYMARKFRDGKNDEAVKLWLNATEFNTFILAFCSMACIVFAPQVMSILYSEKYISGVSVFRVYSCALLMKVTYFGMALNALGKSRYIFYSSLATLCLNIVLNYCFIKLFGTVGAAFATVLSIFLVSILQLRFTARLLSIPIWNIFPIKNVLHIILLNALLGIITFAFVKILNLQISPRDIIVCIIVGFIMLLTYAFIVRKRVLFLLKEMGKKE